MSELHFNLIFEVNQLLRKEGFDYTLHSIGGCTSCGAELRCHGKSEDIDTIVKLMNDYLKKYFLRLKIREGLILDLISLI